MTVKYKIKLAERFKTRAGATVDIVEVDRVSGMVLGSDGLWRFNRRKGPGGKTDYGRLTGTSLDGGHGGDFVELVESLAEAA